MFKNKMKRTQNVNAENEICIFLNEKKYYVDIHFLDDYCNRNIFIE